MNERLKIPITIGVVLLLGISAGCSAPDRAATEDLIDHAAGKLGTVISGTYTLTHTEQDAEYLLGWDVVTAYCPAIEGPQIWTFKEFVFWAGVDLPLREHHSIAADPSMIWTSTRLAGKGAMHTEDLRYLRIQVSYLESDDALEDKMSDLEQMEFAVQREEITTGFFHTTVCEGPYEATMIQSFAAGQRLIIYIELITGSRAEPFC